MSKPTLTPHELEIMKLVWRMKNATVRDVYEALREQRKIAYTTVMTTMKTLENKGFLKKWQEGRAHVYESTLPKSEIVGAMVQDFVGRVFDGSAEALLVHLAEDLQLSKEELEKIARIIKDSQ